MKVSELLSDRSKWTQGASARDKHDDIVDPEDPAACKWCFLGALYFCYTHNEGKTALNPSWQSAYWRIEKVMKKHYPGAPSLASLNDNFGYEAVMEIAREADV